MISPKRKLANKMHFLMQEAKQSISNDKILELAGKKEEYYKAKAELEALKDVIYAKPRLDVDDVVVKIYNLVDDMNSYDYDYWSKAEKTQLINNIMRKLRVIKTLTN